MTPICPFPNLGQGRRDPLGVLYHPVVAVAVAQGVAQAVLLDRRSHRGGVPRLWRPEPGQPAAGEPLKRRAGLQQVALELVGRHGRVLPVLGAVVAELVAILQQQPRLLLEALDVVGAEEEGGGSPVRPQELAHLLHERARPPAAAEAVVDRQGDVALDGGVAVHGELAHRVAVDVAQPVALYR